MSKIRWLVGFGVGGAGLVWGSVSQAQTTAACLAILGLPSGSISLGDTVSLTAECCGALATPAVPGLGPAAWVLALALAVAGWVSLRRRQRFLAFLPLAGLAGVTAGAYAGSNPAYGQSTCGVCGSACSGTYSWVAASANETFSSTTVDFAFRPTQPGTFAVSLSADGRVDSGTVVVPCPGGSEVCDGLDNDCNGSIDDGASSSCPAGPNEVPACTSGACTASCQSGFADCDPTQAGCEEQLDSATGCSTSGAPSGGSVNGDTGGGSSSLTYSANGEATVRVRVDEDNLSISSPEDLCVEAVLSMPSGADYDLRAYCDSCTGADGTSSNSGSTDETVRLRWDEDVICIFGICTPSGSDSGRDVYFEVTYVSGEQCTDWTLTVRGDVCPAFNTCGSR